MLGLYSPLQTRRRELLRQARSDLARMLPAGIMQVVETVASSTVIASVLASVCLNNTSTNSSNAGSPLMEYSPRSGEC